MARITSLEVARMLEEDSDWNDSDEDCHRRESYDSEDDLVDNRGGEDCPLDYIKRYEVFQVATGLETPISLRMFFTMVLK